MASPMIAAQDNAALQVLRDTLPQSLLINAEPGLDEEAVVEALLETEPSEIVRLTPEEGKMHISIEQVRSALAKFVTYAQARRVVVIRPADSMTTEAQNALLKTLEEPNAGLHFILVRSGDEPLLSTIYSRCQILTLHRTSLKQDEAQLETLKLDAQTAQQVLFLAAGRPALIRRLARQPKLLREYQSLVTDAKHIVSAPQTYETLRTLHTYASNRDNALRLLDVAATIVRFQLKRGGSDTSLATYIDTIGHAQAALKQNANVKLALLELVS